MYLPLVTQQTQMGFQNWTKDSFYVLLIQTFSFGAKQITFPASLCVKTYYLIAELCMLNCKHSTFNTKQLC